MTTTLNLSQESTANLLHAARALAACQRNDVVVHLAITNARQQGAEASQSIADAEFGLATAQAALSAARLDKLVKARRLSAAQLQHQQIAGNVETARRQLWSVCSSPDDQLIIAAAKTYGDVAHSFWLASREARRIRVELDEIEARITRAADDCEVYQVALTQAAARHAEAQAAEVNAHAGTVFSHQPSGLHELERAVTDAAHALTGTLGEQFAYSYVPTAELPVWPQLLDGTATK